MHRIPTNRRFGPPEVLLILVALAIVVPLTAWWHAFCQPADLPPAAYARTGDHGLIIPAELPANTRTFAVVGYLFDGNAAERTLAMSYLPGYAMPSTTDPNLILLFAVTVLGAIVCGVYSLSVYPSIRRY
ncbi:MAG TPA: hypothetical protein PLJ47_02835 [Candidatus Hydrogenedentes bacterium]|nr:hypothetical protein [Candidatus Hydrogenedentota bacterium]HRK33506.1 hypothetical protein [Candidatus Hydrogenedentota bacterium]